MEDEVIEIYIPEIKPISVNSAYIPITTKKVDKRGRNIAVKTASPQLREYHKAIEEHLKFEKKSKISKINKLMQDDSFELHISFDVYIPKRYYNCSDASNYMKATEDAIVNFFNFDDRHNKSAKIEKYISEDVKKWAINLRFIFKKCLTGN